MRTKRMLRRGLTALAAALAMMTALAAPAFAYAGDSADSTAETAAQQSSASQTAVQTEKIGTVTTNGGRLNLRDGASTSYNIIGQLPCGDTVTVIGDAPVCAARFQGHCAHRYQRRPRETALCV